MLGITPRSVRRILHNDLHYHPYKIQIVQALNTRDYGARVRFCQEMLDLIGEDEDLVNNIWMSDEAHFHVSGFVNKQNVRYWSQANPRALHEKPLHSPKVTAWCAVSIGNHRAVFFLRIRLVMRLLLVRTAMCKCKISSPHNSPVFL